MRRILRFSLRALGALLLVLGLVLVLTPLGRYGLRAGYEEARILLARRPIAGVIADSTTPPPLRDRLRLVMRARRFAVDSLGLIAGESFTTYVQLDRDTLLLLLSAARRDRLEAYRWWFPIVGRLPYKGFFDPDQAHGERDRFQTLGFDTYLRPASAFSTLGWFDDPLLSTTVRGDTTRLVNTVIHELSHNTLFVAGNAEFSESFASFIGTRGAEAFFRSSGGPLAAARVVADWQDDQALGSFWERTAASLDSAYAEHPGDSALRVIARDTVYARARRALVDSVGPTLRTVPRAWLERMQLDNAALLARRVYSRQLDLFDSVYVREGHDVRRAITVIRGLVRDATDPFAALRSHVAGAAPSRQRARGQARPSPGPGVPGS
jgi:predicted aminopeptidase